jgi:hypothetical protein
MARVHIVFGVPVGAAYKTEASAIQAPDSRLHAPDAHSLSSVHARQVPGPVSHTGVGPLHWSLVIQPTQAPLGAQCDVAGYAPQLASLTQPPHSNTSASHTGAAALQFVGLSHAWHTPATQ